MFNPNWNNFNKAKSILFRLYHKGGTDRKNAFKWLEETYRKQLDPRMYVGLKAELYFYHKHKKKLNLTPAADVGDSVDFTGDINKKSFKIDITTNLKYKSLEKYERLQKEIDAKYKVALVSPEGDLNGFIDVNFPFCEKCGNGRLLDVVGLINEYENSINEQVHYQCCNNCNNYEVVTKAEMPITTYTDEVSFFGFHTAMGNSNSDETGIYEDFDKKAIEKDHTSKVVPLLNAIFQTKICGIGDLNEEKLSVTYKRNIPFIKSKIKNEYIIRPSKK